MALEAVEVAIVGNEPITMADVFRTMAASGNLDLVRKALADTIALRRAADLGLTVSDEDLQAAADRYRRAHGLDRAEDTLSWLYTQGRTIAEFEASLEFQLLTDKLRSHVASEDMITRRFQSEGTAFTAAELSQIVLYDEEEARLVRRSLESGALDFFEAARTHSEDFENRSSGGYIGWRSRRALPEQLADTILSSRPGDVLGPHDIGDIFVILRVLDIRSPRLDASTRKQLRDQIFAEWMAQEMKAAGARLDLTI